MTEDGKIEVELADEDAVAVEEPTCLACEG